MFDRAVQKVVVLVFALLMSHGCGARSTLDLVPGDDEARSIATGGATFASGGVAGIGGRVEGPAGGASAGGTMGAGSGGQGEGPAGGASAGGTMGAGGGTFGSGGSGMGGDLMGTGGAMLQSICDDRAFECKDARSAWLIYSVWGMNVTAPEVAHCVDYNDDQWVDFLDYLALTQQWREGCPPIGPLEPAGTCSFYGDLNQNRCLDLEDYALIRAQAGLTGAEASPCSDLDRSGYVDVVDLGHLLYVMDTARCPDGELDPTLAIDGYLGEAQSCADASPGDINQDGDVDLLDLSGVLAMLELAVTDASRCMDVDRNGTIDLADALHVLDRVPPNAQAATCQSAMDQLEVAVEGAKACAIDSDCHSVNVDCSHVAEHCSQVVYVNASVDADELAALSREVSECIDVGNGCPACDEPSPSSACVMGRCQGAQNSFSR